MEKIQSATPVQAQRLNQLLRIDNRFTWIESRLPLASNDKGKYKIKTSEGEHYLTVSPELAFTFWKMRQGLIKDLCKDGLGKVALALLTNRVGVYIAEHGDY